MRIVCPDGVDTMRQLLSDELEAKLQQVGPFTWFDGRPETAEAYVDRVRDAEGILLIWDLPAEVLRACPRLRIVSFTGTDPRKFIDLSLATRRGVVVTNAPHFGDHAVAEHTFALLLACAKRITQLNSLTHRGTWEQGRYSTELWGKTLGLVGLGGIGAEVARLAQGFGMRVLCWTRNPSPERARRHGVQLVALEEMFQKADVISLHVAHTPETERMIDGKLLGLLKPGAIFINTGRGELVDSQALARLLREGKLGAVGLDVYDVEPVGQDNPFLGMENAVLTPHVGFNTPEATAKSLSISVDNLVAFFSGHPQNVVNPGALGRAG